MKTHPIVYAYYLELTDTFGGEPNYCWIKRYTVNATSMRQALTKFKQHYFISASSVRHITSDFGDSCRVYFNEFNMCLSISEADEYNSTPRYTCEQL